MVMGGKKKEIHRKHQWDWLGMAESEFPFGQLSSRSSNDAF